MYLVAQPHCLGMLPNTRLGVDANADAGGYPPAPVCSPHWVWHSLGTAPP